jgi:hypothetical protein
MTATLSAKVARLDRLAQRRKGPLPCWVEAPHEAWTDEERGSAIMGAAIAEHRAATGWQGPVMVYPPPRDTEEEWLARHGAKG